jgi:putative photosynthetic complex assembly protein
MPQIYSPNPVPRAAVIGAGALVLVTLLWVGATRLGGEPAAEALAAPVAERALRFEDQADGGVAVRDADNGRLIAELEPATNHFVRALMRGLVRERLRQGKGDEVPFQLSRRVDGRLTLIDPTTGRTADLGAFGTSNAAVFSAFLEGVAQPPIQNAAVQINHGSKP